MKTKFQYRDNLYLGESIDIDEVDKLKHKLGRNPLFAGVYVISIAKNPHDQLEIYDCKQFCQKYYKNNPPYIIGIAGSYTEAQNIVVEIVTECLKEKGNCRLKEFLTC